MMLNFQAQKMLLSLDLNIDDILKIPDESLEILNIQGDERFDVKLEIQNEDDLFNEDDFKVIIKGSMTSLLAHTVAQSTKWRFLPKNLNQLCSYFCD